MKRPKTPLNGQSKRKHSSEPSLTHKSHLPARCSLAAPSSRPATTPSPRSSGKRASGCRHPTRTRCLVLESAATRTVFLCPEEEGTVRGAPSTGPFLVTSPISPLCHITRSEGPGECFACDCAHPRANSGAANTGDTGAPEATFHREKNFEVRRSAFDGVYRLRG